MITNTNKKSIKAIIPTFLVICVAVVTVPTVAFADGNLPKEVEETPFAPSRDLKTLKLKLNACEDNVEYHERTRDGWDKEVKSVQKQEREERNWIKEQKNRIKFLKKAVKDNQRTLSRGKYRNGDTLSSDGRTKLERENNKAIRDLKLAESNLERGYKRLASHQGWIRSTKSDLKKLRSKLKTLRARCAQYKSQIKKASS